MKRSHALVRMLTAMRRSHPSDLLFLLKMNKKAVLGTIAAAAVIVINIAAKSGAQPEDVPPILPTTHIDLLSQNEVVRLAVMGDLHGDAGLVRGLKAFQEKLPLHGILLLGDNGSAECGFSSIHDPQWQSLAPLSRLNSPIFPVLGNHEYGNPRYRPFLVHCGDPYPDAQVRVASEVPGWTFPSRNYVIRTAGALIYMIDTTPIALGLDRPLLGSQTSQATMKWLRREMKNDRGWKIVAGHHPVRGSGLTRLKNTYVAENMKNLGVLLEEEGADAYLSGHQHHLELIAGQSKPFFLVSGGATRPRQLRWHQPGPSSTQFASARRGFAVMEIRKDRLEVFFCDERGQTLSQRYSFTKKLPRMTLSQMP